jgi:hypothetical protein
MSASIFDLTAFTDPGRVVMSVLLMMPATERERAASGVCWSDGERRR